ncbi:thermonuclease family protein [Magnetospira sp. QH-2]|uniref:thermonuclease family protein n=1 Tax=Magnetospira sp. (strain QH-2) TaxID=1288970 RepID=UPI0003E81000|nr:thermonuclease family protein [Magnetospira sp. QH-2]CCQ74910.1 putative SNase-like nuclease [Magnetospira sp. QH-2]
MGKIAIALVFLLLSWRAGAADLRDGGTALVVEVVDGDTVILDRKLQNSNEVRLVGIQAPKLPLGRKNFKTWPLADIAKDVLETLTLGRRVRLIHGGQEMDRHGRLLAHLYRVEDDMWLQGEMLARGLARVYSFPDNRSLVNDMLVLERRARQAEAQIWDHPFYALRRHERLDGLVGTFQLVEGRVHAAADVRGTVYLNFGKDWRTDFTIRIKKKAAKLFRKAELDPLSLKGRKVRVRGWLKKYNGPMIDVSHPEQLELLAPLPTPK